MAQHAEQQPFAPGVTRSGLTHVLDPYLHWARLTGFRYLGLAETQRSSCATSAGSLWLDVSSEQALEAALQGPDFVLAEPGLWPQGRTPRRALRRQPADPKPPAPACGDAAVVVGVIDGRCGFAHKSFCDPAQPGRTLLGAFWDQGQDATPPWHVPPDFGYGRELQRDEIDRALERHVAPLPPAQRADGERSLYRALDQALPEDADWSHGTHVLDTLLADVRARCGRVPGLVYVQLPDVALRDTGARWAAAHVLDALHFILRRAGDKAKVVVNLSLGAFGGPHDGSSLLERAIDGLVEQQGGRLSVVVAAGNTGRIVDDGSGRAVSCHARLTLAASGGAQSADLHWGLERTDTTESFMEIWLPQRGPGGQPAEIEVTLAHEASPGAPGALAPAGRIATLRHDDGTVIAAVFNASGTHQVPNGGGGMVLLALAHTRDALAPCARAGRWRVTLTNRSAWPVTLDARIERRDVPGEMAGSRPQYGFAADTPGLLPRGAPGSLARGQRTLVVGAGPADFSPGMADPDANGPPQREPDLHAAGKRVAAGFLSGSSKSLAGTSMAAAQASAALAAGLLLPAAKGRPEALERLLALAAARRGGQAPRDGPAQAPFVLPAP